MVRRVQGPPSTIADLLYPTHGIRDEQARRGVQPRDHTRDNKRRLKEMQAKRREQREAAAAKAAAAAASPRRGPYVNVGSAVAKELARPSTAPAARPATPKEPKNFMMGRPVHGGAVVWDEPPLLSPVQAPAPSPRKVKPDVPTREQLTTPQTEVREVTDFVKRNFLEASAARQRHSQGPLALPGRPWERSKTSLGAMPAYLIDRKIESARKADADAEAARRRAEAPPGHHVLAQARAAATAPRPIRARPQCPHPRRRHTAASRARLPPRAG